MQIKKILLIILFIGVVFSLFLPLISQAGIVPCGTSEHPEQYTLCHLVIGFHDLIDYGFKIVVFVALVAIVISGIMYIVSAGNEQMMQMAKSFIKTTLAGFAIVLGAWFIVNTTVWLIGAKGDLGIGVESWNKFSCSTTPNANYNNNGGNTPMFSCDTVDVNDNGTIDSGEGACNYNTSGNLTLAQCENSCPVQSHDKCGPNSEGLCRAGVTCSSIGLRPIVGQCNNDQLCCAFSE